MTNNGADKKAVLVLADGSVYQGFSFGAEVDGWGEVVFNTSMTGYQEMLTDPSYAGQIVIPTYPLIGNYGINSHDAESGRIQVRGFVVREECLEPSHFQNEKTLRKYLTESNIPGIFGVDTRAITRKLRSHGVMMGYMTTEKTPEQALSELGKVPEYGCTDFVREVSCAKSYRWPMKDNEPKYKVVVLDCGAKYNILRLLAVRGCEETVVPCTATAEIRPSRWKPPGQRICDRTGIHNCPEPRLCGRPGQSKGRPRSKPYQS
jgi:carbamoyl-phosphate synthase small subunit